MKRISKVFDILTDTLVGIILTLVTTAVIVGLVLFMLKGYNAEVEPNNDLVDVSDVVSERNANGANDNTQKPGPNNDIGY